jgi:hypothetical protein
LAAAAVVTESGFAERVPPTHLLGQL